MLLPPGTGVAHTIEQLLLYYLDSPLLSSSLLVRQHCIVAQGRAWHPTHCGVHGGMCHGRRLPQDDARAPTLRVLVCVCQRTGRVV